MNIAIFGSCISRDILNYDGGKFKLINYFARSSIAAACSNRIEQVIDLSRIDSKFQRRVVGYEINRVFIDSLGRFDADLLIVDLIDERFDLLEVEPGAYVTISNEFIKTGLVTDELKTSSKWIASGSDLHRRLWIRGLSRLFQRFNEYGLTHKVVVNKVRWATEFEDCTPLPINFPRTTIETANSHLSWMYDELAKYLEPHQFLIYPDEIMRANRHHRWGVSPFHFGDAYYQMALNYLTNSMQSFQMEAVAEPLSDSNQFVRRHLSDRKIKRWKLFSGRNPGGALSGGEADLSPNAIVANGSITRDEFVKVTFRQGHSSYQVRFNPPEGLRGNGYGARFRLIGWQSLRYIAVGYTHEDTFRHVKIVNAALGNWTELCIGHQDLAYGLQNGWDCPASTEIRDLRFYVSGTPGDGGASLELDSCWIWEEADGDPDWLMDLRNIVPPPMPLQNILRGYLRTHFKNADVQAKSFMERGVCPLHGQVDLAWPHKVAVPSELNSVGTYRFSWHSLHPSIILMVHSHNSGEQAPLFAAREMITNWLDRSYYQHDADKKFTWYDHGTAERLIAMVQMWSIGLEQRFDHRFMTRLRTAIFRHAQLLSSEIFYASHQPTRYHNHAWFQDIALMTTSLVMNDFPCADRWLSTSITRLTEQLEHLIVRDNGFAVFIENSIGYHRGIQKLVEFAGELISFAGIDSPIPAIAKELPQFADLFRYPSNRGPAQGDTFRRGNPNGQEIIRLKPYPNPEATFLPKAGYAIVKGNHLRTRFMISALATSLCRTHKHEDNLSFTLFFDGLEWLTDPSFYSHEYSSPLPAYLRSAVAHNCLALPGGIYSLAPGVAQIDGSTDGNNFIINGHHNAYEDVCIQREIRGSIDRLQLNILDRATTRNRNADRNGLKLMLHCGDGIEARLQGNHLQLTHPDSKYLLDLSLPCNDCKLHYGEMTEGNIRGVTGLGFMQQHGIYTLECDVPFNTDLVWTLTASAV